MPQVSVRSILTAASITLLATACNLAPQPTPTPPPNPSPPGAIFGPRDNFTDRYTLQEAISQQASASTTIPVITDWPKAEAKTLPGYHIWDTWPVRRLDGRVAVIDGYSLLIHLSVPDSVLPGKRHDIAQLRWSYSKDGKDWTLGGLLFPEQTGVIPGVVLGSRNWAGSAVVGRDGKLYVFYTATGVAGENVSPTNAIPRVQQNDLFVGSGRLLPQSDTYDGYPRTPGISYEQRIAVAWGPAIKVNPVATPENAVRLEGAFQHKIILEADGTNYQTQAQADVGPLNAFRDPWVFEDPKDGKLYMLFEGNVGGALKSQQSCKPEDLGDAAFRASLPATPQEAPWYNASIGLAAAKNDDLTSWELLAPLLTANCVNQELERPHFVFKNGKYYLFTASHINKAAPWSGLRFYEGLYGFVGDSIRGDYKPLNGSGLVLNTPDDNPFQQYSFDALNPMNAQDNPLVTSFVDYAGLGRTPINDVGGFSPADQLAKFGGTLAPSLEVKLDGDRTTIVNTWGYGQIRPYRTAPPSVSTR
jgi:levansucrase